MSWRSIVAIPARADLDEYAGVSGSLNNHIPAITVAEGIRIQFRPAEPDFAIEYLTKLAAEATALVQMITEAQS